MVFTGRTSILLSWPGLSPAVLGCHQPGQILRCCGCRPYYCLKAEDLIFAISHIHLGASYAALRLRSNNFLISSLWSPAANCHTPLVLGIVITVQVWSPYDIDVIHEELEKTEAIAETHQLICTFRDYLKEGRKEKLSGWLGPVPARSQLPRRPGRCPTISWRWLLLILVIILGYVCQYHGGVENFSETLLSLNSCCGIGKRWRWDLQIRQTAATKPTCCQTMG